MPTTNLLKSTIVNDRDVMRLVIL